MPQTITIQTFVPELAPHFGRLNRVWLERHFHVEPVDAEMFANPQATIVEPGGQILFACIQDRVVGTVALKRHENQDIELTKMAVDDDCQGLGIGRVLLRAAIREYEQMAEKGILFLESSSLLKPALHLYASEGFVLQDTLRPGSKYARADVYMIFQPDS